MDLDDSPLSRRLFLGGIGAAALLAACSSSEDTIDAATSAASDDGTAALGIRLVNAEQGAAIQTSPPDGLVILDVRTAEEFADGHLEGAIMIDFYRDDFADQIAALDPTAPYLLYCRSGNRSGQTTAIMQDLGFSDVADIDGGITAWTQAGLPTVTR